MCVCVCVCVCSLAIALLAAVDDSFTKVMIHTDVLCTVLDSADTNSAVRMVLPTEDVSTDGSHSMKSTTKRGTALLRAAALKGHVLAQYHLGNCYSKGLGVKLSVIEAAKCYKYVAVTVRVCVYVRVRAAS